MRRSLRQPSRRSLKQSGFTLVAAIFLLVVVAGLVVHMVNLRAVQQTTLVYGVLGARAMQAARSGIEWGISNHQVAGIPCTTTSFSPGAAVLSNFNVTVSCTQTSHSEGDNLVPANTIITYRITSIATTGVFGSLDYVQRRLQSTVSKAPT
ncbi:MAG: MSHA biogenesis protein MshP [Planctomycetota bacterium]|jgi:MSHA biogenesis protein MshP